MPDDIREHTLRVRADGGQLKNPGANFERLGKDARGAGEEIFREPSRGGEGRGGALSHSPGFQADPPGALPERPRRDQLPGVILENRRARGHVPRADGPTGELCLLAQIISRQLETA